MRTFQFSDEKSYKFWNIDVVGRTYTIRYGKVGLLGQFQTKVFANDTLAQKHAEKLIREKTSKGYKETTTARLPEDEEAFHRALHSQPNDLAVWSALADYLQEQGNPRGEFMQVQIALENPILNATQRDELQRREQALLAQHQREWLGELAPHVLDTPTVEPDHPPPGKIDVFFRRGWLHTIHCHDLTIRQGYAFGRNAMARHVQTWTIGQSGDRNAIRACLPRGNIRHLELGGPYRRNHLYSCNTHLTELLENLPLLEELVLHNMSDAGRHVFNASLPELQALVVHDDDMFNYAAWRENGDLPKLERLHFIPSSTHVGSGAAAPYHLLEQMQAIAASTNLPKLRDFRAILSYYGDDAMEHLTKAAFFPQLRKLELWGGRMTATGATLLAESPSFKNLESVTLRLRTFTRRGEQILRATGVPCTIQYDDCEHDPSIDF